MEGSGGGGECSGGGGGLMDGASQRTGPVWLPCLESPLLFLLTNSPCLLLPACLPAYFCYFELPSRYYLFTHLLSFYLPSNVCPPSGSWLSNLTVLTTYCFPVFDIFTIGYEVNTPSVLRHNAWMSLVDMHKTQECSPISIRLLSCLYTLLAICLLTFQGNTINCTCVRYFFQTTLRCCLPAYICLLTYRYFYLSAYFSFPSSPTPFNSFVHAVPYLCSSLVLLDLVIIAPSCFRYTLSLLCTDSLYE